jgi:hypothetical protein
MWVNARISENLRISGSEDLMPDRSSNPEILRSSH